MTQAHNVQRLRWLLKDAGADRERIASFLDALASAPKQNAEREPLKNLLQTFQKGGGKDRYYNDLKTDFNELPAGAKALAVDAAKDLDQVLADIPDETLASDWEYVVREIRRDLLVPPARALAELSEVRRSLLKPGGARMFMIGSPPVRGSLEPGVRDLLAGLQTAPHAPAKYTTARLVESQVRQRVKDKNRPVFVGLVNPNTQGGVFLNSAPSATYADADNREALLELLASRLYGGGRAHRISSKT